MSGAGRLAGLTALVTGASRGIGAAVARRYAAEGATVALAHESTPEMTRLARDLAAELGSATAVAGDLSTEEGPARVVARAEEALGPLDVVVANAALSGRGHWHALTAAEWDAVQAVNVRATWLLAKAARSNLVASVNGSIVTVSSVMAMTG